MVSEQEIKDAAMEYVRDNYKELVEKYAGESYQSVDQPISVYMAGSPGAGKTELSKQLIRNFAAMNVSDTFVRIDPDEVRALLPGYLGGNAYLFQHAATVVVERIHDHALHTAKSYFFDSTFSNLDKARSNIDRCLKRDRDVIIAYSYLDPIVAWDLTRKREKLEGRRIRKEDFIKHFFNARSTVEAVEKQYGDKIGIMVFYRQGVRDEYVMFDKAGGIDSRTKRTYSAKSLERLLP